MNLLRDDRYERDALRDQERDDECDAEERLGNSPDGRARDDDDSEGTDDETGSSVGNVFASHEGCRVLLLTPQFPFFVVGTIKGVRRAFVELDVETTQQHLFEGRTMHLCVDAVSSFYIEGPGGPIPTLEEGS